LQESHRGWDPGSLELAEFLASRLDAPLISATVTRLLIELNRSLHHPRLFSEFSRPLSPAMRRDVIDRFHAPHIQRVRSAIESLLDQARRVIHVGVHTFTPVLDGLPRNCDIGLLYDPGRGPERDFSLAWQRCLRAADPSLRVRRNYPYRGCADGLTKSLRRAFEAERYLGVELEVANDLATGQRSGWPAVRNRLAETLQAAQENAGVRAEV
jgi:predicted N-formylglutamate amidohydrolase